jgi:hypothetical protein
LLITALNCTQTDFTSRVLLETVNAYQKADASIQQIIDLLAA